MKKTEDRELHAIRLFLKILNTLSNEEIWRVLNYLRLRYMKSAKDEEKEPLMIFAGNHARGYVAESHVEGSATK